MYRRSDPRFRRTLNEISQTFEHANESAQANVYSFSHNYLSPCFSSIGSCFGACSSSSSSCFPARDQRRRTRALSRGRAELSFDFYDDWDDDEDPDPLLGWSNDEYDALLANPRAHGPTASQPARQRAMSYGTRRKSQVRDAEDPATIPQPSYWAFLGNLTAKLGAGKKNLRYKPSAADLQEHPGASSRAIPEGAPLLEDDEQDGRWARGHNRTRSDTQGSGNTTDSLSSRGDIFPSEDELDDAIPLDDEFAMVLERRTTNSAADEPSSGKKGKRPSAGSRLSTRTMSSRSSRNSKHLSRRGSSDSVARDMASGPKIIPSMAELKQEEDRAQEEEEARIVQKREAAQRLAAERLAPSPASLATEKKAPLHPTDADGSDQEADKTATGETTTPFPAFDPLPSEDAIYLDHNNNNSQAADDDDDDDNDFNPAQLPRLYNHGSA